MEWLVHYMAYRHYIHHLDGQSYFLSKFRGNKTVEVVLQ